MEDAQIEEIYSFPKSGSKETNLVLYIYSITFQSELKVFQLELANSKYKIKDIKLQDINGAKIGDIIKIKKLKYIYKEEVTIFIEEFEIQKKENNIIFINKLEDCTYNRYVDCYFLYKICKENFEFIGFNNEILDINLMDLKKEQVFKKSGIYYFRRLEKLGNNKVSYIQNVSYFSEFNENTLFIDKLEINTLKPFSFRGKILQKDKLHFFIMISSSSRNKLISISKIEKFKDIKENQYIEIYFLRLINEEESSINFETTDFTYIKTISSDEKINKKICLKFNILDFKDEEKKIIDISKIEIELSNNVKKEFSIQTNIIFFVYENNQYEEEYFPQKINLFSIKDSFSYSFQFFAYKGFLNEIFLFVRKIYGFSYEFLYFSIENFFPDNIEIKLTDNEIFRIKDFQTFGNETRKKITFLNIPAQDPQDYSFGNSFLKIFLCKDNISKLYGTFLLNSIIYKAKKDYDYSGQIQYFLRDIYNDFKGILKTSVKNKYKSLIDKYIKYDNNLSLVIEKEINKSFQFYNFKDELSTLNYFNNICLWNLFNHLVKYKMQFGCIGNYLEVYEKIIKNHSINYIEKSMALISIVKRVLEDKISITFPKLVFYDELEEDHPYKMAYNFQFQIIQNLTEKSCLFQPFLFLDSYIMECIISKSFSFVTKTILAYSISLLPLESIKNHLLKTIKNYFLVIERTIETVIERKYYASVHKFNSLVTYNENIILLNSKCHSIINITRFDDVPLKQKLAFIINIENMHENFSHNKELLLNINAEKSPSLYFDRDFKLAFVHIYNSQDKTLNINNGEAGRLVESFICEQSLLEKMKNTKYDIGKFFDIKYFVDIDFKKMVNEFQKLLDEDKNENVEIEKTQELSCEYTEFNDNSSHNKKNIEIRENNNQNISEKNIEIRGNIQNRQDITKKTIESHNDNTQKDENTIVLPKSNAIFLSADTIEELLDKFENLKNKKFIQSDNSIERENNLACY